MRQDDPSDCLHVIARGRVQVSRAIPKAGAEPALLTELGPGDVVGEMGVLDAAPRSATVTAVEPTDTICISADLISAIMLQYPRVSDALFQLMSERIRSTEELADCLLQKSHNWLGPW
jgi:CRP-like cAMP-binding protein